MEPLTRLLVHIKATRLTWVLMTALLAVGPRVARAQLLSQYLPSTVPGYGADPVMAIIAAGGPDYNSDGVRVGNYVVRPALDETIGFDENPLGLPEHRSSATIESQASVGINSNWERNAIGGSVSIDDHRYPELPIANTTTTNAYLGGTYNVFEQDHLSFSGGYTSSALSPTNVLTQGLTAPVPYSTADLRTSYSWHFNHLTLTPEIDYTQYRFGTAYGAGLVQDYSGLNKNQINGGAIATYALLPALNAVLSWQEVSASFVHSSALSAAPNYLDTLAIGGIRDDEDALFHWAILAGVDARSLSGPGAHNLIEPAFEAALTYYPTRLTTIMASVTHRLSDASYNIAQNVTYTEGAVELNHALRRNVILIGKFDGAHTDADAGSGAHTQLTASAGALWLLSRNLHLSASYILSYGSSDGGLVADYGVPAVIADHPGNGSYTSNAVAITVRLQL